MLEYIDKELVPYMSEQRRLLNFESEAPALCIFDVFAAHGASHLWKSLDHVLLNMHFFHLAEQASYSHLMSP